MEKYKLTGHVSSGAHGVIFKAIHRQPKASERKTFAIKRIFVEGEDLPISVIREVKSLQLLSHEERIISLIEVFPHGHTINLVFPLSPTNLTSLIYDHSLSKEQQLAYSFMIIEGVEKIHSHGIIHRDMKPANILITWKGTIKICDFGQSRMIPEDGVMSHQVSTRWYRSPELLYGSDKYGSEIDMWSVGCLIWELFMKKPLFSADSDIGQLFCVISKLGPPPVVWASAFPDYNKISFNFTEIDSTWLNDLKEVIKDVDVVDAIMSLVRYQNRSTALELLTQNVFASLKDGFDENLLVKPTMTKHLVGPPRDEDD